MPLSFFFKSPINSLNRLPVKFIKSRHTRFRTGKNSHLRPKPVSTRLNARQCGEVKPAQFKDRTSDLYLFAYSPTRYHRK
ncbi:hypothetical protein Hanom_Chr00s000001g01595991 [Helianthus anomalus]